MEHQPEARVGNEPAYYDISFGPLASLVWAKLIPDGWIGRSLLDAPFNSPPNRLDDCETFLEFKPFTSLAMKPNARAQQVQAVSRLKVYKSSQVSW